jgi:SAM-dependent methyltransferase
MGIDVHVLNFLAATRDIHKRALGRTLMLGRQGFHIATPNRELATAILHSQDPDASLDEIQPPGEPWADGLFRYLGSTTISTLDAAAFEGADIIHDLNLPVPASLHGKFDAIFDGGTIEHIFNTPAVLQNIRSMLAPGGLFLSVNAANNQLGHGLYQFSPELMWRAFAEENGYLVEAMYLAPLGATPSLIEAPDPRVAGKRLEIGSTPGPTYLVLAARRVGMRLGPLRVYQSDYESAWGMSSNKQTAESDTKHVARPQGHVAHPAQKMLMSKRHLQQTIDALRSSVEKMLGESSPHLFSHRFFRHIGWTEADFSKFVMGKISALQDSLAMSAYNALLNQRIAHITHKIWLTSAEEPSLPPEEFLKTYLSRLKTRPIHWMHYFWTNSKAVAAHVSLAANEAGCSVLIQETDSFFDDELHPNVRRLLAEKKYVLAADVLKILILDQVGGVYSDMGVDFDNEILSIVEVSNYCVLLGTGLFFQTSFLACSAGSDLSSMFRAILNNPESLDVAYSVAGTDITSQDEVNMLAGPGFTACALLFIPLRARTMIFPPQSVHLSWQSEQSWYGSSGKHGNVVVSQTSPTLVDATKCAELAKLADQAVKVFGNQKLLSEQLRLLSKNHAYFERNPTRLCDVLSFNGSDKSGGWHNYGYVYNYLFGYMVPAHPAVMEIGLGTNFTDVPSSMGASGTPGASLRSWREWFSESTVIGADIDRRILFTEPGIRTYFVDQTRKETINELFKTIGDLQFDVVIDDGLHTFAANVETFRGAFGHVKNGGLYVVEDVEVAYMALWDDFLRQGGYAAAMIKLPSAKNNRDNCIILVIKGHDGSSS